MSFNKLNKPWVVRLIPVLILAAALILSAAGTALATLSGGSTFESGDGNLVVNGGSAFHDWNGPVETINCLSVPPANCALDLVKSQADNSLGQGSKEDDPAPTVVSGSIPPSKDDLSRFYVNKERAGSPAKDYLYLAWERSNLLGSAHMDFEFNQSSTPSANGVTPQRTAGDMLIDFDFGGSGVPVLALHRWITDTTIFNASTDCEASNTLPCWNKAAPLPPSIAEAQVNSTVVTDTNPPNATFTLAGNTKNGINSTFGEAGINLTDAGVFPTDRCVSFGSAYLKSRSSGNSFSSELKDFIAPIPILVSNCGAIKVVKVTDPSPDSTNTSFSFTLNDSNPPNTNLPKTFNLLNGGSETTSVFGGSSFSVAETVPAGWDFVTASCDNGSGTLSGSTLSSIVVVNDQVTTCTFTNRARGTIIVEKITDDGSGSFGFTSNTLSSFTLTTSGAGSGGKDSTTFSNLAPGTYDVAETVPAGWDLVSKSCSDGSDPASIGLSGGETVTCTFHDARQKGAIQVTKTRKHAADGPGDHPQAGVSFTVTGGDLPAGGVTAVTNAQGIACVDGLVLSSFVGNYTVAETVPSGYSADNGPATVTVSQKSTCGDGKEATASFHNTPLTDLTVTVNSQIDGGTSSTIICKASDNSTVASGSTGANGDGSATATNLEPGTYTCTVVIDP